MRKFHICWLLTASVTALLFLSSCEGAGPRKIGEFCVNEADCESGLCYDSECLNPDGDYDLDGLKNGIEKNITGTSYGLLDTDSDGIDDGTEVAGDPLAPVDTDGDGIIDALESLAVSADPDKDCIPDQYDPENNVYNEDMGKMVELHCIKKGVCGEGIDKITALCTDGTPVCNYSAVIGWEAVEASCDSKDNDCDGKSDEELTPPDEPECAGIGVCAGNAELIFRVCREGSWQCEYSSIDEFEKIEVTCDSKDNNCDGDTDEGLTGQECFVRNEYGKCAGATVCTIYGGVTCEGTIPAAEICNNFDDNCNGLTDEGLTDVPCSRSNDFGTCEGTTGCDITTSGTTCSAREPAADICDTIDNNCDGDTDENNICSRTSIVKMHVYGSAIPTSKHRAGTVGNGVNPLVGATVDFYRDNCPTSETDVPIWSGLTEEDGAMLMPLEPGFWCIQISADGFQTMLAASIYAPVGVIVPLDSVLLLNGLTTPQLSLCGRVMEKPEYAVTGGTSANGTTEPVVVDDIPVAAALISVTSTLSAQAIGNTVSDVNGYWCIFGLQTLPADGALDISIIKDAFYPGSKSVTVQINKLTFDETYLSRLPTDETICLGEGFEGEVFSNGWTVLGTTDYPVQWVVMQSYPCVSQGYTLGCSAPFANEVDIATTETILCKDPEMPIEGCLVETGALPSAVSGYSFAWFGNPSTCSYSPTIETCGDITSRITGSLISPWIDGMNAWTLFVDFVSAWEVESMVSQTDMMYVEAQTSAMEATDTWSQLGSLRDLAVKPRAAGVGITGYTSGGVNSAPIWQNYSLDLEAFTGTWFRIRFRFDSIDGNNNFMRGWQIDDVVVRGAGCTSIPGL